MSLRHAILVMLEKKPGSGYDLSQRFKTGIGNFWNASHQQVYQELKKLHKDGLLKCQQQAQADKPDRKLYRITASGRAALKAWLHTPQKLQRVNSAMLVKVFGAALADPQILNDEVQRHTKLHRERLQHYLELEQRYLQQSTDERLRQKPSYLTLRSGIRYEWMWISWLQEARDFLGNDEAPSQPTLTAAQLRALGAAPR